MLKHKLYLSEIWLSFCKKYFPILFLILLFSVANANIKPDVDLRLTDSEKQWLADNPEVLFTGDPNWLPYEAFDANGNYIGIVSEHLQIISDMTGIEFVMSPSDTWTESTNKARRGEVAVLSETDDSDLKSHLNFTVPYITNPIVIVMKNTEHYVENINVIKGKKIALIKDYGYASKIRRKYSDITFITVDDIQDGLIAVSTGEVDALLCTLALCSYTISDLGLNNVKITGKTEFDTKLAFGVQKDMPELLSIMNKAIKQISLEQQQRILDSWIKDKFVEKTDYTLVYQVILAAAIVLVLFALWNRSLQREIKLRIETEGKLDESRRRYQNLFDKTADALLIIDGIMFVDCNQATLELLGYETKDELINTHPSILSPEFQPDGRPSEEKANEMIDIAFRKGSHRFEWVHKRKNGEEFPVEVLLTAIMIDDRPLLHVVWRDITERKNNEAEIERQAYYDALTDLPNRKLLLERLEQALITGRRHNHYGGLLFIDLDRFKTINDSLGHSVGDDVLIDAANRIHASIFDEDTVSRFGGDEFIVLLRHVGKDKDSAGISAEKVAGRIQDAFKAPFNSKGHELHISTSIGIALFPFGDEDVEDIIKHADTAMYSAKQGGRNQIAFYLAQMHEKVMKRLTLEKELLNTINDKKLNVCYQPLVDSDSNIIAVEALVRWKNQDEGFIQPEEFIPIAEDTGLIYDIGAFVLNRAINDITELNKNHGMALKLSVNISPNQFRKQDFVGIIEDVIMHHKLEKDFLTLEVTEHIAIENLDEAIQKFQQLRKVGVRLALDDFGTGYSSLSHLKRLPIDVLKIDKSFVCDIEHDPQDALLVKTIINIAHQFDLEITAEGVETREQLDFLINENCHVYQGYFYSEPVSLEQLQKLIVSNRKAS